MRFNKISALIFLITLIAFLNINPQISQASRAEEAKIQVMYSKNIEVFCTLINLTDFWEKRPSEFAFAIETRERFLPYKNHEAVKMTQKLLQKSWVWHSFFCHLALYHADFPQAQWIYQPRQASANKLVNWFYTKYIEMKAKKYIPAVRDFYLKSDYEKFWQEKQPYYENLKMNLEEKISDIDIAAVMEDFYGMEKEHYFIVPSPQMPMMALNVEAISDGKPLVYDVQGPFSLDEEGANYFGSKAAIIDTASHEFGHTFLEPLLMRHKKLYKKYSYIYKKLDAENQEKMRKMGYAEWDRVLIENLIRAVQARLWEITGNQKMKQWILKESPKHGFQLIPILYDIIEDYVQNRNKYKDFETFFPLLLKRLDNKMKNI
jgi:hypothetical protein